MPKITRRLKSLDTEVTGIDLWHGARPYFVTMCERVGNPEFWEWDVNPLNRQVVIPPQDLRDIQAQLNDPAITWVFQNAKFDLLALKQIGIQIPDSLWGRIHDTLYADHLLASNKPHDLTSMAMRRLRSNIAPYELAVERCVKHCKSLAPSGWLLAKEGLSVMPSAKKKLWKYDMWLPRTIARLQQYPAEHEYWTVLRDYGNVDSEVTIELIHRMLADIERAGLMKVYQERLKLLPVVVKTEANGVVINEERYNSLYTRLTTESDKHKQLCINLTGGTLQELPVNGRSKALDETVFGKFQLISPSKTPTGAPSMDKEVLDHWLATLDSHTKAYHFVSNLRAYRRRQTGVGYLKTYRKFAIRLAMGYWLLHPSLNPTGTDTLRWTSSNPNEQQISKQEDSNLRYAFGPGPGREWWSLDYDNLELRIPAYEAEEPAMLELFEHPDKPPYFGSYHLLIFSILHPDKYDHDDPHGLEIARKKYKSTWYQWTKNGNFAELYGAVESSGTADAAFHIPGAQRIVAQRLKEKSKLNQSWINYANKHGYVETIPDREVDPLVGYRLRCPLTDYGKVSPTVPLNYHVQGTACWVMMRAMILIQNYFDQLNAAGFDNARMVMNVHDEVVLDLPYAPQQGNRPIIEHVQGIMGARGNPIGVRLTAGISYHPNNWGQAIT